MFVSSSTNTSSSSSASTILGLQTSLAIDPEAINLKRVINMLNRIEKMLVPEMQQNPFSDKFSFFGRKATRGEYFTSIDIHRPTKVSMRDIDWNKVEGDVYSAFRLKMGPDAELPPKAQAEIDLERNKQKYEIERLRSLELLKAIKERNNLACMPGKWHKDPYAPREYDRIADYVATSSVDELEGKEFLKLLNTPLDGFLGQAYNYDDHSLTEEWMVTFKDADGLSSAPSDDQVIRTQIESLMEIIIGQVQDRVCTELGVLRKDPVGLGTKLKEAPVWGIDCYTRRMVELAIQDYEEIEPCNISESIICVTVADGQLTDSSIELVEPAESLPLHHLRKSDTKFEECSPAVPDEVECKAIATDEHGDPLPIQRNWLGATSEEVKIFIEKRLLPSINAQAPEQAHNMWFAVDAMMKSPQYSERDQMLAKSVLTSIERLGMEHFKIHPKGTGVICTAPEGLDPHVVVAHYLGELYPPYRWCEKLDVVEQAQKKFGLKPTLPDFYNILLERPRQDPKGYGIMWVDASQRANLGSSCSHSCNPNCTSAVVARDGRLMIALTTTRAVLFGEELSMDYYSITNSDVEWRASVCLCGMTSCRGSFLHYATQDDLQQVLNQNCGILWRYSALLRACSGKSVTDSDRETLNRHGMGSAALGDDSPAWVLKYAAENLRYVEFERKALPCALLRPKNGKPSQYTYSQADMDARTVMEQRLQSMVCCFSMVSRVLCNQGDSEESRDSNNDASKSHPLQALPVTEAVKNVWELMAGIPSLIRTNLLTKFRSGVASIGEQVLESSKVLRVEQALSKLERMFVPELIPKGITSLRAAILGIREILLVICDCGNPHARINLLCDVLVFWAHTSNYSSICKNKSMVSAPVSVVARELGTNIKRSSIFPPNVKKDDEVDVVTVSANNQPPETTACALNEDESAASTHQYTEPEYIEIIPGFVDFKPVVLEGKRQSKKLIDDKPVIIKEQNFPDVILNPNELVYTESKTYNENFIFWQLMGWYNAGTDIKETMPDLFGSLQLPLPINCFGQSLRSYGPNERKLLMNHLRDEKAQMQPWPDTLRRCFSNFLSATEPGGQTLSDDPKNKKSKSSMKRKQRQSETCAPEPDKSVLEDGLIDTSCTNLLGSPFLDVTLGHVDAVIRVMQELFHSSTDEKKAEDVQFDNILPPELPTEWVQCDKPDCRKWRRVAWNVDVDSLPDSWECNMNDWDPENATCDVPQDSYDPDRESTVKFDSTSNDLLEFELNTWRDVYCLRNKIFYEAQVKGIREKVDSMTGKTVREVKFHFKGWKPCFDEWIEVGSSRLALHNLHTNPTQSRNPRVQEKIQVIKGFDHDGKSTVKKSKLGVKQSEGKNGKTPGKRLSSKVIDDAAKKSNSKSKSRSKSSPDSIICTSNEKKRKSSQLSNQEEIDVKKVSTSVENHWSDVNITTPWPEEHILSHPWPEVKPAELAPTPTPSSEMRRNEDGILEVYAVNE